VLIAQAIPFFLDNVAQKATPPSQEIIQLNAKYPFGAIIYTTNNSSGSLLYAAGKAVIMSPPDSDINYIPRPSTLQKSFNATKFFAPCLSSNYGSNTPDGYYFMWSEGMTLVKKYCT
jgi:hypothetical protein